LPKSGALKKSGPKNSSPWILAATNIGSSMAFIDGTIVNVTAPKFLATFPRL